MAYGDYLHCAGCDDKMIYDGDHDARTRLENLYGDPKASDYTVTIFCPKCHLAAIEQARREEREAWRGRAAQWLHDRARAQECTNIEYPSHAASYPNWSAIVSHADQFAFELERELAAILARKP